MFWFRNIEWIKHQFEEKFRVECTEGFMVNIIDNGNSPAYIEVRPYATHPLEFLRPRYKDTDIIQRTENGKITETLNISTHDLNNTTRAIIENATNRMTAGPIKKYASNNIPHNKKTRKAKQKSLMAGNTWTVYPNWIFEQGGYENTEINSTPLMYIGMPVLKFTPLRSKIKYRCIQAWKWIKSLTPTNWMIGFTSSLAATFSVWFIFGE